jgi:hypothetical protein
MQPPNLDGLAVQGSFFKRGYTECPSCFLARRTLMTGLAPAAQGMVGMRGCEWDPPFTVANLAVVAERMPGQVTVADIEPLTADESDTPYRKLSRMRWSALIKRVYEVDPLCCPKCGGTMAIVSFIEQEDQADVIERILKHCQLWDDYPAVCRFSPVSALFP